MNESNDVAKMKTVKIEPRPWRQVSVALSLRLPVNARNRAVLRRLRAMELAAWNEPVGRARQSDRQSPGRRRPTPLFRPNTSWL